VGNVLGVNVAAIEFDRTVAEVMDAARSRRPLGVSALAVHGVMTAVKDPTFQFRLNDLEMVVPDGQPVRWALNWLYDFGLHDRVSGTDLMYDVCEQAAAEGIGVFLFGSTPATVGQLQRRLSQSIPGLHVTGVQPSRFRPATPEERLQDVETIRASGASIVMVGLGCPRQEIWTFENRHELSMPVLAVGAAFDFHAGVLKRAPKWMRRAGLEWVYRLYREPRRLAGRYLRLNPAFVAAIIAQKAGLRAYAAEFGTPPPFAIRPS
jgi:N-acetylglucosaminyldiphosphoundecaprenol N-acetyl-beta-D-mannosaminyltransferase